MLVAINADVHLSTERDLMTTPARKQSSRPLRIALVDAHPVARLGLRSLFESQPSFAVVSETSTLAAALPAFRRCEPDVLITDAFPIPQSVFRRQPTLCVLYTFETLEHCSLASLTQELRQGRAGFVLKTLPLDRLRRAVRQVASGRPYRDPGFRRLLTETRRQDNTVRQMKRKKGHRSTRRDKQKSVKNLR
ncbi:MAG: hypothetical protein A4C66_03315 [Nitrospira sp. HN-bin3]|jgi:DNA-binding NarL/FixJ family response regulator|nr:MAG: hypothetical protein A4C66_03315 [Nitrospira sp. HN-bin3]